MKKMFPLFVLVSLLTNGVFAQKVKYKKDQVTIDDKPYCTMTSKGFLAKDYTVKNLEGKTVMTMKGQYIEVPNKEPQGYYQVSFIESGSQCEFNMEQFNVGTKLAEDMVEAGVFVDGKLAEEGEKRFLNLHKRKFSEEIDARINGKSNSTIVKIENVFGGNNDKKAVEDKPKKKFQLVERNREGALEVWLASKAIEQDFKKIGYYTETQDGMKVIVSIHLPEGKKVAKVIFEDAFAKQGTMTTFSDDEERVVKVAGSMTNDWVKSLAQYLIDRDYL